MSVLDELKKEIQTRLPELETVVGWGPGFSPASATPLFMRTDEDVEKLVFGPTCVQNPATYLTGLKGKKVGVVVKGCDSRSIIELMQEGLLDREELVVFGAPCEGVVDLAKLRREVGNLDRVEAVELEKGRIAATVDGERKVFDALADKCLRCRYPNALTSDVFAGEPREPVLTEDPYEDLEAFLGKELSERFAYWQKEMDRCIRCHACRNACPMCVCRDHCVAQSRDPKWLSQADSVREKWMFQLIHAMHLAGRCTECGECSRACPVDIDLMKFKRQINRAIKELFDYEAGVDPEATPPLLSFKVEEENINERGW